MIYIILLAALFIAVINWIKWLVSTRTLIYWLTTKNYTQPSDKEIKVCSKYVIRKMLGM